MVSYGVVTRNEAEATWPAFDRGFYEVKDVTGRVTDPIGGVVNMVSCFGDNDAAETDPELVPVDGEGVPATRDQPYFDWAYVCPTHPSYRRRIVGILEDCAAASPDVRLDDVGFPRQGYCRCDRCDEQFGSSDLQDRDAWRAEVITGFLRGAIERIPGRTVLTLYPDPYPGHLYRRAGIDLDAISSLVDEVVVPLYDTAYGTTYWLEALASGFRDALEVSLTVELYAVQVEVDALVAAGTVASEYADGVLFAYDAEAARSTVRRLRAEGVA